MSGDNQIRTFGLEGPGYPAPAPHPGPVADPLPGPGSPNLRWYAAYTRANHEKHVAAHLSARAVDYFLPLYPSIRRWKDRRVQLQLPLFPGYIFVRIALCDRLQVLEIPSVARLVGFNGAPAALPQDEIETLKSGLEWGVNAVPHRYLTIGRQVRLVAGPLAGLTGILLRHKGKSRVAISIDLLQRTIVVDADINDIDLAC